MGTYKQVQELFSFKQEIGCSLGGARYPDAKQRKVHVAIGDSLETYETFYCSMHVST